MIDNNDYTLAWQAYLAFGVVATLLWGLLIRVYRLSAVKLWAFLAVALLLLLPCRHPEAVELWMPATIGAALSVMTSGIESAMAAVIIVGAGQLFAIVAAIVWALVAPRSASSAPAAEKAGERVEPKVSA
ncbi:hypothetical protein [Spongiibacter sp. UBA1325]|jgi:glucan phosphoethanolaminetransferase (alkaline phosphatase superfamily)|uniref:hypothetical protein n=1 Tax=Spongiibacter sp. UBA1325 TaxID=1947543 RepID=UPI00257FCD30|nr:hypothetical protein [Spongiibacter sp. UBA1325]|tara:strand:- start:888 stop:1277 length:390 start_codon:yes stop_codon:yes gene_type:complete